MSHLFPLRSTCHVLSFNFFIGVVSEIQRSKVFPTWLPHHVTDDVIILIVTFCISCQSDKRLQRKTRKLVVDKQTNKPEVVWEQTNTCEKEHKELSWQKSRIFFIFFLPHVKDRTFWKLWEFYVTSSLDRFS